MKISIEKLVEIITREVVSQLLKSGIEIDFNFEENASSGIPKNTSFEMDFSEYRTPVLTENNLSSLKSDIKRVIVPSETIVTPGARDIIKKRNLIISYKIKS